MDLIYHPFAPLIAYSTLKLIYTRGNSKFLSSGPVGSQSQENYIEVTYKLDDSVFVQGRVENGQF